MNVRCREFTRLLGIKRSDFLDIIMNYPDDYEKFCEIKDSINFNNQLDKANLLCISCNKVTHSIEDCPYLHYIYNKKLIF